METTSVTSKGQVTIPKPLRQQLGLRGGSKVEFILVDDHAEMRVVSTPAELPASGFGMLKSKRAAVPADFDPADLLARGNTGRRK
ncbi:MAG: AbrB/MazE/SpoVT family DNA-binding domain-containing protein [Burkholderiales bacterium]